MQVLLLIQAGFTILTQALQVIHDLQQARGQIPAAPLLSPGAALAGHAEQLHELADRLKAAK